MPEPPALILVHGACLNGASWNPVLRQLDARWSACAIDLPGHGSRRDEPFTVAGATAAIVEAAAALAPRRVVLAGDSLGGYTSLAAAAHIPDGQLAGLVVGGCTQNLRGKALWQVRARGLLFRMLLPIFGEPLLARSAISRFTQASGNAAEEAAAILDAGVNLRALSAAAKALAGIDFISVVRGIDAPVLFFNGNLDLLPVRHEPEFLAAAQQGSRQRFDCEHGASLWCTAEVARMTNQFMEALA